MEELIERKVNKNRGTNLGGTSPKFILETVRFHRLSSFSIS